MCASLGEFTENNPNNFLRPDPKNPDLTTNVLLQYTLTDDDKKLWDVMDQATYKTIEAMSGGSRALEYWDDDLQGWTKEHPAVKNIRIPGIVHEASTSYVGDQANGGSLDELYRPHGLKNLVCSCPTAVMQEARLMNHSLLLEQGYSQQLGVGILR